MDAKDKFDVVEAALKHIDSEEYREAYGEPPGDLRAHLIRLAGELQTETKLPLHINRTAADEILED